MSDGMERYIRGLIVQRGEAAALEVALDELGKARARLALYPELVEALRERDGVACANDCEWELPHSHPEAHTAGCKKATALLARADEIEGK